MKKLLVILCLLATPAAAQWQVPTNAVPFGRGAGTGFNFAAAAANSILATNASSVPGLTTTLPSGVQDNITRLGTIVSGVIPVSLLTGTIDCARMPALTGDITVNLNNCNYLITNLAVTTAKLADNSVSTAKIIDSNVTTAKILDGNITTVKILDGNVTNVKLANMTASTYKMRVTASTGAPEDATATQATAGLNAMVGDSGSGGTKGLVPAPAIGDRIGAQNGVLTASGTWVAPRFALALSPKTANYTALISDCGTSLGFGSGMFTLTVTTATDYNTTCILTVINEDASAGKIINISGIASFILWPKQIAFIVRDGSAWQVSKPGRWKVPGNVEIYVNNTSGNDANDCIGTGAGRACKTINAGYARAKEMDFGGIHNVNVNLACPDNYNEEITVAGHLVGAHFISFVGDISTPSNCVWTIPGTGNILYVKDFAYVKVYGIQFQRITGQVFAMTAEQYAGIDIAGTTHCGDLTTGRCVNALPGGNVNIEATLRITGNAEFPVIAQGGIISITQDIVISTARAFNTTCWADFLGKIIVTNSATFTGAGVAGTTGTRFNITQNSLMNTNGVGANYCPGNAAGTTATGGQYL